MGNDVQSWRAHIGMFNGSGKIIRSARISHFSFSVLDIFPHQLLHALCLAGDALGSLVVHCCLFIILLIEIATALTAKGTPLEGKLCKKIMLQSLCNPCLVASLSLLMRILLLRSGNVKSNPGPKLNHFSISCWNVDSLLTREGIIKIILNPFKASTILTSLECVQLTSTLTPK